MDVDHHRDCGHSRDFYHPKGCLLNFGSVESEVSTLDRAKCEFVCLSVCLFVILGVIELLTQLKKVSVIQPFR